MSEQAATVEGRSQGTSAAAAAERPAAIELRGLRRDFGERTALAGVNGRVNHGETLAVLGPNGSGKSTLLRILATLLRPSGGTVSVLGEALPLRADRLRGRVGYLGHEPLLYRDLTARENLDLTASLHRLNPEPADLRIRALLEEVGLAGRADSPVRELSAGMTQRLDVCRVVLPDPELLLLDEPDSHLDTRAREVVAPLLGPGDRTRVLVSHDREAALAAADSVLELE